MQQLGAVQKANKDDDLIDQAAHGFAALAISKQKDMGIGLKNYSVQFF